MRVLMYFHGGSGNRGCEAIVRSAIKVLRKNDNDIKIGLASTDPDSDKHIAGIDELIFHNQERPITRFSPFYFRNLFETRVRRSQRLNYHWMHQDILNRMDDYDVFLSIGGDNYCYGEIPDYYELNRQIRRKGKRLFLWGASVGKEDINSSEKLEDLRAYTKLLVRESLSLKELTELGLTNLALVADGAFVLDKEMLPLPKEWEEDNTIGFNFSPLVEKKYPDSRNAILELITHIIDKTSYKIALTPHVIQDNNDDHKCLARIFNDIEDERKHERMFLLPENLNALQYKGYISRMRFFIGARTHATIAAYSSCVPSLVLGYSIKSLGVSKDLFSDVNFVLEPKEWRDGRLLMEKFDELVRVQNDLRNRLTEVVPEIQDKAYSARRYIN